MSTRSGLSGSAHTRAVKERSLAEVHAMRPKPLPVSPSSDALTARALYEHARMCPHRAQRLADARSAFEQASDRINARIARQEAGGRPRLRGINVERSRPTLFPLPSQPSEKTP